MRLMPALTAIALAAALTTTSPSLANDDIRQKLPDVACFYAVFGFAEYTAKRCPALLDRDKLPALRGVTSAIETAFRRSSRSIGVAPWDIRRVLEEQMRSLSRAPGFCERAKSSLEGYSSVTAQDFRALSQDIRKRGIAALPTGCLDQMYKNNPNLPRIPD
ncbi:exported hypothetical protein [Hyphomicrobiales bacterium]|nr:exported hypothetical protein [Hyphomicrobiales bacterium]CAH1667489.1 exported hypothetical protein [Hyphomicrobiales bacterium]